MYFAYVDETGIDGKSPLAVMTGIVVNDERLTRTQAEFAGVFKNLGEMAAGQLRELKSADLFAGKGAWRKVDGLERRQVVTDLCQWLIDRKHTLALAAISHVAFQDHPPEPTELKHIWKAAAFHIALQLQRLGQAAKGNKGRTVLVFDDNKYDLDGVAELMVAPPAWTDDFYERGKRQEALSAIVDTPFAAKSHLIGLVQVADVFSSIFRRHAELADYGHDETYSGEAAHVQEWADMLAPRLIGRAHRWPARPKNSCAQWYCDVAPLSLRTLG